MSLRRKFQIAILVCALADTGLIVWLLSPRAPSQAAAAEQLESARVQLGGLRAEHAALGQLSARLDTSRQQMQTLMAEGIPNEEEASSKLLTEFSRIATDSQVQVSGAEFHPDKAARQNLRRIALNLQVAGTYGGVVHFINGLERSPMFFIIDQVSVSGGAAKSEDLKLDLQLEAYANTGPAPGVVNP